MNSTHESIWNGYLSQVHGIGYIIRYRDPQYNKSRQYMGTYKIMYHDISEPSWGDNDEWLDKLIKESLEHRDEYTEDEWRHPELYLY